MRWREGARGERGEGPRGTPDQRAVLQKKDKGKKEEIEEEGRDRV